ncbi:MAG: hypothetical protein RMK94_07630 [Armatimonadota bacterium]|nr:hypothetical protein [Armatimonadota bacterium]
MKGRKVVRTEHTHIVKVEGVCSSNEVITLCSKRPNLLQNKQIAEQPILP